MATHRPIAVAMSFADAAGDGCRLARFKVEYAERRNHAADRTEEAEQGSHGDDDAQIVETAAQFGHEDARLHFDEALTSGPA